MKRALWSGSEKTGFSFYSLFFSLPCTWSATADAEDTAGMRKKRDIGGTVKDLVGKRRIKVATDAARSRYRHHVADCEQISRQESVRSFGGFRGDSGKEKNMRKLDVLTAVIIALSLYFLFGGAERPTASTQQKQEQSEAGVTVTVTPESTTGALRFRVALETHTVNLDNLSSSRVWCLKLQARYLRRG